MWCHVRHLNLDGKKLQRIRKEDRAVVKKLNYEGVEFPVSKKDYGKIEVLNKININVFCYENKVVYPVYLSNQGFNDSIDLLLISNDFVSPYVYIKDFNRLMFNKTKHKGKKYFCKCCSQCFSGEKVLIKHKKDGLLINGAQNVKLEKGFISFKTIPNKYLFLLKFMQTLNVFLKMLMTLVLIISVFHIPENIKIMFLVVLLKKLFVLMINTVKMLCCTEF